jgi:hypothetical protein
VTHSDHLADDAFSELVDRQLSADEMSLAHAHLETCSVCQARLAEMRALVGLLRALPSMEPPRDFRIGPRLVADPPNVVRLRRWYAVTRAGAGALAAAFVFLSVGTLYVDSRPPATSAVLSSKAQPAAQSAPAPETVARDAVPTPAPAAPTSAPRAAAAPAAPAAAAGGQAQGAPPAAPALSAPAPAAGAAVRSNQAAPSPTSTETGDQIAAATTVRPLPTQVPTPTLQAQATAPFASPAATPQQTDPAAPLRLAAALVGVLAAFGILLALLIRHRLLAASPSHSE